MADPQPDLPAQRCTCDDWVRHRARFMVDDPRRCCAHLVQGYLADPTSLPLGLARHQRRLAWCAGEEGGFPLTRQILALSLPDDTPCEAYVPWDEDDPWMPVLVDGRRSWYHRRERRWREDALPPAALAAEVEAALGRALALGKELPRERGKGGATPPLETPVQVPMPQIPAPQGRPSGLPGVLPPQGAPQGLPWEGVAERVEATVPPAAPGAGPRFQLSPVPDAATGSHSQGETPGLAPWKLAVGVLLLVAALGAGYLLVSRGPLLELLGGATSPGAVREGNVVRNRDAGPVEMLTRQVPPKAMLGDAQQAKAMRAFMLEQPGAAVYVLGWDVPGGRMELVANLAKKVLVRAHIQASGQTEAEVHQGFVLERLALAEQGKTLTATPTGNDPPRVERFFTR